MELDYLVFCEAVDHTSRGSNLVGVFDVLHAQEFPVSFGTRLVYVTLRAKKALYGVDIEVKLVVEYENEEIFTHTNKLLKVQVLKDFIVPVEIGDMQRLMFEQPGKYYFKFYISGRLAKTRPLDVRSTSE